MPIMANILYRDMFYFFYKQFTNIFLLVLLTAFINAILEYSLCPNSKQILMLMSNNSYMNELTHISLQQLIQHMSTEQQNILLKASAASTIAGLISNVLLVGGLLTIIRQVSNHQTTNVIRAINLSAPLLPRLLLIIFLTTLLIQLGLLFIIVPGIIIAIAFSLAPIITICDNLSAISSMILSANLALINLRLLVSPVLFWLLSKALILVLATKITLLPVVVVTVLLNSISNLIASLILIYLYRLYMFLQKTS